MHSPSLHVGFSSHLAFWQFRESFLREREKQWGERWGGCPWCRSVPNIVISYFFSPVFFLVFAVGLGDITQQLNQSELAVLLNLLQSQTDLSVAQMAQLLNIHSNPEMQQQLEALNQSINALNEATTTTQLPQDTQKGVEEVAGTEEPPPPAQPSEGQATPEAASTQGDVQSALAILLSQLIKTQEPVTNVEENNSEKSSELRGPRKTPTLPQEETAGK